MHEYSTPCPGKTAPRLLEDLLDYDARYPKNKKYHLLADPAPQYIDFNKLAPLRKGERDCRHELMIKPDQSSPPLSADPTTDFSTPYVVAAYCSKCRYHFQITVDHARTGSGLREPCRLGSNNPLHHFRYVQNKSHRGQQPGATSKYDGHTELHYFKCSNTKCPAFIVIKITPPRFGKELAKLLADPAKIDARRKAAVNHAGTVLGKPDRFDEKATKPSDAYYLLYRYLRDALTGKPGERKRVVTTNKSFTLAFGDDCDEIWKYLDFTESEEEEADGETAYYWNLPCLAPDGSREQFNFLQDVSLELLQRISDRRDIETLDPQFKYSPSPALKQIERCLGCWGYPRKSRQSENSESLEHPHYSSLGACEDFTDDLITFSYVKQKMCDEPNKPYYLDCLAGIATGRHSVELQVEVAKEESSGELRLTSILEAYRFFGLDLKNTEGDDHIIGVYRSRIDSAPRQKDEARNCLKVIAQSRKSTKLEAVADDRTMTSEEAYNFLEIPSDTDALFIDSLATIKANEGHRLQVVKALRVIANTRSDPFLHTSATRIELEGVEDSGNGAMEITQAYRTLQIEDTSISDQNVLMYYKSLMDKAVGQGSVESIQKALECVARNRKSHFLLAKADDLNAAVEAPASTAEHPVGLQNIGNTCYLNSLLQFYYTVKPIREIVMNFENYRQDVSSGDVSKRVGGQLVNRDEIIKAQQFVEELGTLYSSLKTASTADVRPSQRLAELALLSTGQEKMFRQSSPLDTKNTLPKSPRPATAGLATHQAPSHPTPPSPESVDVEMSDAPPSYTPFDEDDTSSEATLVNSDHIQTPDINRDLGPPLRDTIDANEGKEVGMPPRYPTPEDLQVIEGVDPSTDATMVDAPLQTQPVEQNLGLDTKMPEKPPPIPPRTKPEAIDTSSANDKTISAEMLKFGAQQDVTEVIQNVLFRISCAIKPTRLDAGQSNEQVDQIRNTFFGQSASYLKKTENETRCKQDDWNNLSVFPASDKTRSIYEALDVYFDPQSVDYEDKKLTQYSSIKTLPPILQILIQRTGYDKASKQVCKNQNWIAAPETIYLDRYLDSTADSSLMARRQSAWEWKKELRELEDRKDVLAKPGTSLTVPEAISTTKDYLKDLQEEEIEGLTIDPGLIDNLEGRSEELTREIEDLETSITELQGRLDEQFADLRKYKYTLQAVFMHRGTSAYGHYWIYIYDFATHRWREYNDERVQVVEDTNKIFSPDPSVGAKATPYFLVYVRDDQKDDLVDAVCRDVQTSTVSTQGRHVSLPSVPENVDEGICMDEDDGGTSMHIEHAPHQQLEMTMMDAQSHTGGIKLNKDGW